MEDKILGREEFDEALQRFRLGLQRSDWKLLPHDSALRAALAEAQQEVERLKRVNQAICKHAKYWIDVFESSPHDEGCGVPSQIPPVEEYTDEMLAARPCTCRKARVIKNAAFVLELPLVPSLESPEGSILPQVRHEQVLEIQRLTADLAKERETSRELREVVDDAPHAKGGE